MNISEQSKEKIYHTKTHKICRYGDCSGELVIVGAGPAGLATSVCLNQHSIPNVILGKENYIGACKHLHHLYMLTEIYTVYISDKII